MSLLSTRTPLRRALAVAAPLTVLALSLTACAPTHVTTMDSPTPSGSDLASPYEPSPAAAAAQKLTAAGFLKADTPTVYQVKALKIGGADVSVGKITGISVFGDAGSADGATFTPIGVCTGALYSVTGQDGSATADPGTSANPDKCADAADAQAAKDLDSVLAGKLKITVDGENVTVTGSKGVLDLTATK